MVGHFQDQVLPPVAETALESNAGLTTLVGKNTETIALVRNATKFTTTLASPSALAILTSVLLLVKTPMA